MRYDLIPVLAVAVCATLARARSFAEWAGDAGPELRAGLGLPGAVPDLVTIWRVLTAVDPAALDRALGMWITARAAALRAVGPGVSALSTSSRSSSV